jgi:hypothetical protein
MRGHSTRVHSTPPSPPSSSNAQPVISRWASRNPETVVPTWLSTVPSRCSTIHDSPLNPQDLAIGLLLAVSEALNDHPSAFAVIDVGEEFEEEVL